MELLKPKTDRQSFLRIPLRLQYFAENEAGGEQTENTGEQTETPEVVLTPDELKRKIEAESDRKLDAALKKREATWKAQMQEAIEQAKKEGMTYAQMTEKQREEAEKEKERLQFEQEREQFYRDRLTVEVKEDLLQRKLPTVFADTLVNLKEKEKIAEAVSKIEAEWNKAINDKVKEALAQDVPYVGVAAKSEKVNPFAKEANEKRKGKVVGPNPWG